MTAVLLAMFRRLAQFAPLVPAVYAGTHKIHKFEQRVRAAWRPVKSKGVLGTVPGLWLDWDAMPVAPW